jgi:hypothetical protein
MDQPQRSVAALDVHDGASIQSSLGGEVFERPAVEDERLFDRSLMQRCVHRFTESRMAESVSWPVHTNRGPVDDDAHAF